MSERRTRLKKMRLKRASRARTSHPRRFLKIVDLKEHIKGAQKVPTTGEVGE